MDPGESSVFDVVIKKNTCIKNTLSIEKIRYVVGDERTTGDIAKVPGEAIGKPGLQWVRFSDGDALNGMLQAGLTKDVAETLVQLGQSVASGASFSEYKKQTITLSPAKLEDFAKEFAAAYLNS